MIDKLIIKKGVVITQGFDNNKYYFNNTDELCEILFRYFNYNYFFKIYLHKKVDFQSTDQYKILQEGTYINDKGQFNLKIVVDKEYLSIVKGFIYNFGYKRFNEEKEFKKVLDNKKYM